MWPWHVKMTTQTCWGCYCCSCWWWGTCWLRLWSPILVKMFKFTFCWYLVETLKLVLDQDSEDVWSRNYFGKQNSTLGSVVPLAMFSKSTFDGWQCPFSIPHRAFSGSYLLVEFLTPVWPDRDKYIQLNEENIDPLKRHDFEKRIYGDPHFFAKGSVDTAHSPYDVSSAQSFEKRCETLLFQLWRYPILKLSALSAVQTL